MSELNDATMELVVAVLELANKRIREQCNLLDECEKALAGLFGECDNHLTNKESWDKARATLDKLRKEQADE